MDFDLCALRGDGGGEEVEVIIEMVAVHHLIIGVYRYCCCVRVLLSVYFLRFRSVPLFRLKNSRYTPLLLDRPSLLVLRED